MTRILFFMLVMTIITCQIQAASIFSWFWGKTPDESTVLVADGVPLISIPYESMTDDEKFLQEAAKLTEIQVSSPLETCQHKVIMKIRTSCSDMSEEELAKLSVNLLNCQSAVEGRKMFPCTEEMSLKQCTTDMDADMWNAYHLMSNRARAVCYAARSTQFRALTELTVNKLMQTAHSQIDALQSLKESQDHLEEQTIQALSSLSDGNKVLLEQQKFLKDAQTSAQTLITTNLKSLYNEKALIRSGHMQLIAMTEDIKNKLERANQELMEHAVENGENHKEILDDLMNIQMQTKLIWERIEHSTNQIIEKHEDTVKQYTQTLEKLTQINDTINFIWNLTNTMRAEVDQKLSWITGFIGNTGEQFQKFYRITLHIVYLLVAMIVAAFLHAPFLTRATIMGIIPLNLSTYVKYGLNGSLDLVSITLLIFLITAMHYVMVGIQRILGPKLEKQKSMDQTNSKNLFGFSNGDASKYTSPSVNFTQKQENKLLSMSKLRDLYKFVQHKMYNCIECIAFIFQSVVFWHRQSIPQEELSCSYVPSKKTHDELISNHVGEYSSISDDATDMETSYITREKYDKYNDINDIVSASELRRRLDRNPVTGLDYQTSSRSTSPSSISPRMLCYATTKTGKKCRLYAAHGGNYCSRHSRGFSIMDD